MVTCSFSPLPERDFNGLKYTLLVSRWHKTRNVLQMDNINAPWHNIILRKWILPGLLYLREKWNKGAR